MPHISGDRKMFFIDLMIVFVIAVILSLLFAGPFAWRRLQEPPGTFSFGYWC